MGYLILSFTFYKINTKSLKFTAFRVAKTVAPSDPAPQDINLNSDLFVLWGVRPDNSTAGSIPAHRIATPSDIPAASIATVNPAGPAIALEIPVSPMW